MPVTLRVDVVDRAPAAVRSWWRARAAADPVGTMFQSPEWVGAWSRHFAPDGLRLVVVADGRQPVALFPGAVLDDGRGGAVLHAAGHPFTDRAGLVGGDRAAAQAVVGRWFAGGDGWDAVAVEEVPACSPLLLRLPAGATARPCGPTAVLALDPPPAPSGGRHLRQRRRLARLLEATGARHTVVAGRGAIGTAVEDLAALFVRSWAARDRLDEVPAGQREARFGAFLSEACSAWAARGLDVAVAGYVAGDRRVSGDLVVADRGTAVLYLTAHDPAFGAFSPGRLTHDATVERARRSGCRSLDLGRGDEAYKLELGATTTDLVGIYGPAGDEGGPGCT